MPNTRKRINLDAFSVTSFAEADAQDRAYWRSLTPLERMVALEEMRQLNYDYDPVTSRFQRTLEVLQLT